MYKLLLLCFGLLVVACAPRSYVLSEKKLARYMAANPSYQNSFHGLCVYDLGAQQYVAAHNADRYFTPASNTKLFTFYAALKLLPKQIPTLHYQVRNDSLFFWGTGDPTWLHPVLQNTTAYGFLKAAPQTLVFSPANFQDEALGSGWAWNDYNASYQPEKSALPLYGNTVRLQMAKGKLQVWPRYFAQAAAPRIGLPEAATRLPQANDFFYNPQTLKDEELPFRTSGELSAALLADTLKKPVAVKPVPLPPRSELQTLNGVNADSLYRQMLQTSDNFLAEHILLLCAAQVAERNYALNTNKTIDYVMKNFLADLSQKPRWVDGSGLSRYNLFTPRANVELLRKIYQETAPDAQGEARLFSLLPQAGTSGTLRGVKVYPATVYAKTGSLSNNHNLSGYLVTKSGKRLAFSFMNNHYTIAIGTVREEMGKILTELYEKY